MRTAWYIAKQIQLSQKGSFIRTIIGLGVLSVSLSIAVLLMSSAMLTGFKKEITQKIYNFWGHIHVTDLRADRSVDFVPIDLEDGLIKKLEDVAEVNYVSGTGRTKKTRGGIDRAVPFVHLGGIMMTRDDFLAIYAKGVDERFDWDAFDQYLVQGRAAGFIEGRKDVCLVSKIQANKLQVEVGDAILMQYYTEGHKPVRRRYIIAGVYDTGLQEYDEKFTIVPLSSIQSVMKWPPKTVTGISITVDYEEDIDRINDYLYLEAIPQTLYSEPIRKKFKGIFDWLDLQEVNEWVMLVIMLVVCFINLSTVMIVLILERTQMIGVLKALGARSGMVMRIFVVVICRVLFKGMIIGNAIGLVLILLQDRYRLIKLDQENYYLSYAPVDLAWTSWLSINVFVFMSITLFMFIPSLLISSVKPISILRFK